MFNTIPYFVNQSGFDGMSRASAAVFAVMVATATLLPDYTFYLFALRVCSHQIYRTFYIVVSFIGTVGSNAGGNIAHPVAPWWATCLHQTITSWCELGRLDYCHAGLVQGFVLIETKSESHLSKTESARQRPGWLKAKLARRGLIVFDKISDRGYESLTKDEKEKLFNASKKGPPDNF